MSYQLIPNIIFIAAVTGMIVIILRHLPEAISEAKEQEEDGHAAEKLQEKGLPAIAISKARTGLKVWGKKSLNFMLEVKDLTPNPVAGYNIKKMFKGRKNVLQPATLRAPQPSETPLHDENYFLTAIKESPRNLAHYNGLGKLYINEEKFQDAADIFQYLTSHEPTNAEYYSKAGQCFYKLKDYDKAIEAYEKSLALDPAQPNRYYNLGMSAEGAGDLEKAANALGHAIHLEPKNGKYYMSLSTVHVKRGNKDLAIKTLKNGRKMDSANLELVKRLNDLIK